MYVNHTIVRSYEGIQKYFAKCWNRVIIHSGYSLAHPPSLSPPFRVCADGRNMSLGPEGGQSHSGCGTHHTSPLISIYLVLCFSTCGKRSFLKYTSRFTPKSNYLDRIWRLWKLDTNLTFLVLDVDNANCRSRSTVHNGYSLHQ